MIAFPISFTSLDYRHPIGYEFSTIAHRRTPRRFSRFATHANWFRHAHSSTAYTRNGTINTGVRWLWFDHNEHSNISILPHAFSSIDVVTAIKSLLDGYFLSLFFFKLVASRVACNRKVVSILDIEMIFSIVNKLIVYIYLGVFHTK